MLDHSKVAREVESIASRLFFDASPAIEQAMGLWNRMAQDPSLFPHVLAADSSCALPRWNVPLDTVVPIHSNISPYTVVAVDGSQIYPDRHQGTPCFLINIGLVLLRYGTSIEKRVHFETKPYIFAGDEDPLMQGSAIDYVNCQREAFEFADALAFVQEQCKTADMPMLLLFDGSLVFWHLESKEPAFRKHFFQLYYSLLTQLAQARIPYASYLSLPRNQELIYLMRFACDHYGDMPQGLLDNLLDVHIMGALLPPQNRSAFFAYGGKIAEQYPESIRPSFCYCNVEQEIARVELPAWLCRDDAVTDQIIRIVLDQAQKGRGYPVALAEAHEQAVVKNQDREIFYHLVRRAGMAHHRHCMISQKSLKKRTIGI